MPALNEKPGPAIFDVAKFGSLLLQPKADLQGVFKGIPFTARIAIPNYGAGVARHYAAVAPEGLAAATTLAGIPFDLPQFGLIIDFEQMAQVDVHTMDMVFDDSIRTLVSRFGVVVLRNACIAGAARRMFHRNTFSHLQFHIDRGPNAANQYSCFTRDPDDPVQRQPRASSTLFIANIVAWLESVHVGNCDPRVERGTRANYSLYGEANAADLFSEIILEQPWDAPEGIGEIAVIDNRTVLHAAYHKDGKTRGYPIGARYLI